MSSVTQTWLEDPASIRGILVEVTVKDLLGKYGTANTDVTLYLSNIGYTTSTADVSYLPYLTGSLQTTESLSIDGGLSMSFGDIEILNPNGELDSWLDSTQFIWVNRSIQIYLGDPRWTTTNIADVHNVFEKIFDGVISDIDSSARETLNIKVRDKLERLNTPLTSSTLGTYGTWASGQTNQDSIRPIVFGEVHNMSPLLINPALLEYMFTDTSTVTTITTITRTSSVGNVISCVSTQNFAVNNSVVFTGTGVFGGIVANTVYYIKTIPSSTTFTISSTVGGTTFVLTTATAYSADTTTIQAVTSTSIVETPITGASVSLLLRTSNNATYADDSSSTPLSVTNNPSANATQSSLTPFTNTTGAWDTTTYPFGSLAFNGTGSYLSVGTNARFAFGTGNFTCEAWVYVTDRGKSYTVFSNGIMNNMIEMGITAAGYPYAAFGVMSGGKTSENGTLTLTAPTGFVMTSVLSGGYGDYTQINGWWVPVSLDRVATTTLAGATFESLCVGLSTATINSGYLIWGDPIVGTVKGLVANVTYGLLGTNVLATGTWHHLAIVRSGTGTNQTVFYVNGVAVRSGTVATNYSVSPPLYIGATTYGNNTPTLQYKGNITNLRILKGGAAYTAAFTPTVVPFSSQATNSVLGTTTVDTITVVVAGVLDPNLMTATVSSTVGSVAESVIEIRYNGLPAYTNPAIYTNNNTTRPAGAIINLDSGKFTLTSQPFGTVTASVQGIKKSVDLSTGTLLEGTYTNNIAKIIALIVTEYGNPNNRLTASDLDLANLLAFSTANTAPIGTVILDRTNVLNACQLIAASASAQLFFNRKGLLQLLKLGAPTSDAVIAITDNDILFHSLNISTRTDVVAATKIGYCKNYTVQSTMAGNVPARDIVTYAQEWYTSSVLDATIKENYKIESTPEQQNTCLITKADADALALSINNYFKVPRTVYSFVGKSSLFSLKLGQAVTLTHNRFGLSNGKSGQVISLSPDWVAGTINVEVII
jgi:hypothetical protein